MARANAGAARALLVRIAISRFVVICEDVLDVQRRLPRGRRGHGEQGSGKKERMASARRR